LKVTSIKVDEDLWKRLKILAVKLDMPLGTLLNRSLEALVEGSGEPFVLKAQRRNVEALKELRSRGKIPLKIVSKKSAVELVREGRGD
jgi:predicted transcriptional regulator